MEYYRRNQLIKAFEHVNQSINLFIKEGIIPPPSMLYSLKYSILIRTESWEGAWPGIKSAVQMFPDYVDLRFYMGVILYCKQMYQEALDCFQTCIQMGEDNLNYLSIKGLGSFRAWFYTGLCFEKLNDTKEALLAYLKALMVSNNFQPAREAINNLIDMEPAIAELFKHLKPEFKRLLHGQANSEPL